MNYSKYEENVVKREVTVNIDDLIDAIESVETPHGGDQDMITECYKTDILQALGYIKDSRGMEIKELKNFLSMEQSNE